MSAPGKDSGRIDVGLYALDQDPRTTTTLGMYHYLRRLLDALDALPAPDDLAVTVWVSSAAADYFPRPADCRWIRVEAVSGAYATGWRRLVADHWIARRLARRHDILHMPKGWLPFPAPRNGHIVATLPDAIPAFYATAYPDYVTRKMRYFQRLARHTLKHADRIITISVTSVAALRAVREPQAAPVVIPAGAIAESVSPAAESRDGVLVLGSPHPHKRTDETLDLLNRYAAQRGLRLPVTITGLGPASARPGNKQLDCHFAGRVSDETLTKQLRSVRGLVFLSEIEGFGLPLLEAYEQGTPVCYRNVSAMAEVMDNAPGGWDGRTFESFCVAMDAVLAMDAGQIDCVRKALQQRFNWPDIARRTLAVYREVAGDAASQRIRVLSTPVDQVTYDSALGRLRGWLAAGRGPGARSVIAANVHVVTEAAIRPDYHAAVDDADLVLPDGMPLVWASRALGGRLQDRCYGPELMQRALGAFAADGARHFFYGSTADTLARLKTAVAQRWPDAIVVGELAPPFGDFDDAVEHANIERINAAEADFVWLALGCPKQERWMQRYRRRMNAVAVLGVGAAFDFIAGTVPQAPPVLQRLGLEWAFRLVCEPRRLWRRYLLRNPYFLCQFLLQRLGLRWRTTREPH